MFYAIVEIFSYSLSLFLTKLLYLLIHNFFNSVIANKRNIAYKREITIVTSKNRKPLSIIFKIPLLTNMIRITGRMIKRYHESMRFGYSMITFVIKYIEIKYIIIITILIIISNMYLHHSNNFIWINLYYFSTNSQHDFSLNKWCDVSNYCC